MRRELCQAVVDEIGMPDAEEYSFPELDAKYEKLSFVVQTRRSLNDRECPVPPAVVTKVQQHLEEQYTTARWSIPPDPFSPARIEEYLQHKLNLDSNPGYPLNRDFPTNREVVEKCGVAQLVIAVTKYIADLKSGSNCFPVRLFIKREAHKRAKIIAGRRRLIWSVALFDQVIDGLMFDLSLDAEIEHCREIPSKPGLSEFGGGVADTYDQMSPEGEEHVFSESDMSSWDMTVPRWLFQQDGVARKRLCLNWDEAPTDFKLLWAIRYNQLMCSPIVFSDGLMLIQNIPGIVRSGSKTTISANSRMQVFLKYAYCEMFCGGWNRNRHLIFATGDDTIGRMDGIDCAHFARWLVAIGFEVKEMQTQKSLLGMTFCGRKFVRYPGVRPVVFVPAYWKKNHYSLAHPEKLSSLASMLGSYCLEYAFDDAHFPALYRLLKRVDVERRYVRSREFYQNAILGYDVPIRPSLEFDDNQPSQ